MENCDRCLNLKSGINYCFTPKGKLGCRGVHQESGFARLVPLSDLGEMDKEIFFFHGVDVPAAMLPYIPDMGPSSPFQKVGHWHYYDVEGGIFIDFLEKKKGVSPAIAFCKPFCSQASRRRGYSWITASPSLPMLCFLKQICG